jgi:exopolysaccharide biosynthesis polyprenyl glycosylphosphotransferase
VFEATLAQWGQGDNVGTRESGAVESWTVDRWHEATLDEGGGQRDARTGRDETMGPTPAVDPPLRRLLIAFDVMAIGTGWVAGLGVALLRGHVALGAVSLVAMTLTLVLGGVLTLSATGLYRRRICANRSSELARIARSSLVLGLLTGLLVIRGGVEIAATAGLAAAGVSFTLLAVERGFFREWIKARRANGDFVAPVLVVAGTERGADDLASFLVDNQILGLRVAGVVTPQKPEVGSTSRPTSRPWLGSLQELTTSAELVGASGVVLDAGSLTGDELNDLVRLAGSSSLHVHISSGVRRVENRRITVSLFADETFLHVAPPSLSRRQDVAKRFLDVVLASFALLVLAPILAVAGALIWLQDRGPVLFRQERIGRDGEPFTLYKLRTMLVEAEQLRSELESDNGRDGPLFKVAHDPRITPIGRFLRASSLDEAPQLLNVLEGTMSLVGPRPALPAEAAVFDKQLLRRLRVKPGMTGLWQVEARDLPSFDLYRRFDLHYVENWSLALDLTLIARTTVVVAMRTVQSLVPGRLRRRPASGLE